MCDQAKAIRKNGWLSELEREAIKGKQRMNARVKFVESNM